MASTIRAVIFDFDGVLANTERLHLAAFRDAFAAEGWTLSDEAYFTRYLGYNDVETIDQFARDQGLVVSGDARQALLGRKSAAYRRRLAADGVLYPGAASCVARLAPRFRLAIASGSLHAEIEDILVAAGLREPFAAIVGADDVRASKPSPEPYLAAADRLGVDPTACVAIEDSSWGLMAARTAGMATIALTTTAVAAELDADRVLAGLDELSADLIAAVGDPRSRRS